MIMYFYVHDCLRMATRAVRHCSSFWAFDLFSADQRLLQIHKTEIDPFKYVSSGTLLPDSDNDEDDHFGRIDARRRLHLLLVTPDMTSL